jgi:pimeloyl-ACP methyl ester carboxylesterase
VVYCHGNSGCRLDSFEVVQHLLPRQISVFVFDFSGSGLSEGAYVTLGFYESKDINTVVAYLTASNRVSRIALWGRSMGAVSAVLYASTDPSMAALVLDSPFSSLKALSEDIAVSYKFVPRVLTTYCMERLREAVQALAAFDMEDVNTARFIKSCRMPTAFIHSLEDDLVDIKHTRALFEAVSGEKLMFEVPGTHNSMRSKATITQVLILLIDAFSRTNTYEEDQSDDLERTQRLVLPKMEPSVRLKLNSCQGFSSRRGQ